LEGIERTIHAHIGVEWPCAESSEFDDVWSVTLAELDARGLRVGRETFGEWDDGDMPTGANRLVPHAARSAATDR
jgi:hypothetical protein